MIRPWIKHGLLSSMAVLLLGQDVALSMSVEPAPVKPAKQTLPAEPKISERATSESLGGAERFLTFVSTDKPIYRISDHVHVRGVLMDAINHKPMPEEAQFAANLEIKGPKGEVIFTTPLAGHSSLWYTDWNIPVGSPGGEYTARVTYPTTGYAPAERKFDVRDYRAPRLKTQMTFMRDGYGPGDKVTATLEVSRAEGGIPAGATVTVDARVDGTEITCDSAKVDEHGLCTVSFDLPKEISKGEGTLSLVVEDGGVVESASKSIPIVLKTVSLQVYPEGGDLVAGLRNRVYIQANQTNGKPADVVGKLMSKVNGSPWMVTEFRTEHEGRGRFEFTPDAAAEYYITIVSPTDLKTAFPLPKVKTAGAVIHADKDVYDKDGLISVKASCSDKTFRVSLAKREVPIADYKVDLSENYTPGQLKQIRFTVPRNIDGVLTVTVFDSKDVPLAERLIFREAAKSIKIAITPKKKSYVPGENAELTLKATDADGKPISTILGLTVTDDSVLGMVDKREQAPRLPVMMFLEPEVKDLADASIYLDPGNPKAALATDLLLGTQGWRRFALMNVEEFLKKNGDQALRVVAFKKKVTSPANGAWVGLWNGQLRRPEEIGRVEGPRDTNMFQVEPTVIDERYFTTGRAERHQKTSPTLPEGAPLPDGDFGGIIVKEFAHQTTTADAIPDLNRKNFTDTIYWSPAIKTNATTGEATIKFGLNDSVTTFRVVADAFSSDGAVASADAGIESVQPFYAEVKMPLEVTTGDQILLPINMINATGKTLSNAVATVTSGENFTLTSREHGVTNIANGDRLRWLQPITVGSEIGIQQIALSATAGNFVDIVSRKVNVKPLGFPIETAFGGMIESSKPAVHTITIPKLIATESLRCDTVVYPTPLANMTAALERLIVDPYGCFEQTASTTYPLTMAQQYFLSHNNVNPTLIENSRKKLDVGYKKLVSYWCPDRGYEWFGQNPGHEPLTAFGLMLFTDMKKVREVDQAMIDTTRAWLLKQRDGKGGFNRRSGSSHAWIEDKACSNAYIVWALLESGQAPADLTTELAALKASAAASQDSYVVALAANALHIAGDKPEAKRLMERLASKQKVNGGVDAVKNSIVGSSGESLEIEGTALATLAWLRDPAFGENVERSVRFLAESCKAGRYGSTQSTVLALRSIIAYDVDRARPRKAGRICAKVDGKRVGDWVAFDTFTQGTLKLPELSKALSPGEHKLEFEMDGGSRMPYTIAVNYNTLTPASSSKCNLNLDVKLRNLKLAEGASTEAIVTVSNLSNTLVPSPVAIVGLPGGLEPRHDQLKELVKQGTIDSYEVRGREVLLYWRGMQAQSKAEVPISLVAAVPGTYTGTASSAYLFYTNEHKKWTDGIKVEITPKLQIASTETLRDKTITGY